MKQMYVPSLSAALSRQPRASRGWYNKPGELKFNDTVSATYNCDTTGSVTALNLLAVGSGATDRDGRQITCKSVAVQGLLAPIDGATNACYCRVMLVWDSQCNGGAIATITQILNAATSLTNTNLDNRERFTILRDFKYAMGSTSNTATQAVSNSPNTTNIDWFVPLKGMVTTYNSGTTAAITSIATGALLLVTIGNQATTDCGAFIATTRLRFYDK